VSAWVVVASTGGATGNANAHGYVRVGESAEKLATAAFLGLTSYMQAAGKRVTDSQQVRMTLPCRAGMPYYLVVYLQVRRASRHDYWLQRCMR